MRILLILLVCVIQMHAQTTFNVLQGDTLICDQATIQTSAVVTDHYLSSQSYTLSQITYNSRPLTGTLVNLVDDSVSPPVSIGFSFCFYGTLYTQAYIGSNGWLGFSAGQSPSFTSFSIPNGAPNVPKNCIMGPWYDINTGIAGANPPTPIAYVYYYTAGVAPYRHFVVSWVNAPLYQCIALRATQQIVIYETTGVIENSVIQKRVCMPWANGTATQGLHNSFGTTAITAPGRNSSVWTVNIPETWRYTPSSPNTPQVLWYINGVYHGQGSIFVATLVPGDIVQAVYVFTCSFWTLQDSFTVGELPCCNPINLSINTNQ